MGVGHSHLDYRLVKSVELLHAEVRGDALRVLLHRLLVPEASPERVRDANIPTADGVRRSSRC